MTFFFGRRRSQSDVASDHAEQDPQRQVSRHSNHPDKTPPSDSGIFHGLFRRKSDSSIASDSSESTQPLSRRTALRVDTHRSASHERSRERSRHRDRSSSRSGASTPRTPGSPDPSSAAAHAEPKQPGNIQDYLECRLDKSIKPKDGESEDEVALKKKDVKAILSGAPHFLLERGKHGRWYPQVIFPWDEHNPSILRMLDRKPLSHASFTLCTLHAHLPVPDDWAVKGGVPIHLHSWHRSGGFKRASFDVGVFEVPNMLANNGREPGTVGYRHFLEFDIADMTRYSGPAKPRQAPSLQHVSQLPATEAFELMESYNKPYSQCLSGAVHDRLRLLQEGPTAWKRIGVRDINMRAAVQRLAHWRQLRLKILTDGSTTTVLDYESPSELHNHLFTHFLHPHPPPAEVIPGHSHSLKSQIKTITTVLSTPGAWVDFSLPEWRYRAGQLLWEAAPHADGDCMDECSPKTSQKPWINSGMERKWLLVQLVLAAELIIRLDAFVRMDMLHDPHGGSMTIQELQTFDKLREGKVNWDLIVVRRFLDNLEISCDSPTVSPGQASPVDTQSPTEKTGKAHRFSLLESINRRVASSVSAEPDIKSAWQCQITSPHVRQQLEGLFVFAENIGWPKIDTLKSTLHSILRNGEALSLPAVETGNQACSEKTSAEPCARLVKGDMYTRSPSRRCIRLRSSYTEDCDPHAAEKLGWISRSWLSGFVLPGEGICHLLIGTLLENDQDAISQLGPTANLYGGFIYENRSWWSKACIVGRVLSGADGAQTCMGWVGCDIVPCDANTLRVLDPGWFEINVQQISTSTSRPRIKHGVKVALESTPLGTGDITADAFTLPIDNPTTAPATQTTVTLDKLTLAVNTPRRRNIIVADEASLSFALAVGFEPPTTITLPLAYNARFISAHECRPPLGFLLQHQDGVQMSATDKGNLERLPGHPLHQSFGYKRVSLADLPHHPAPQATPLSPEGVPQVLVIDARGSRSKETFVRAWCASVGSHALVGRVGRTCIACCVREARAINVSVVVRVGDETSCKSSS